MYQSPTAPQSIGGVLDDGFQLLKACFMKIFGLAVVSAYISQVPNFFMQGAQPGEQPSLTAAAGVAMLLSMLVNMVFYGAILARVSAAAHNQDLSIGGAMGIGLSRFLPLFFCAILYTLALVGGMVVLIIPGIILSLSLAFGPYLVITERLGPIESLKASHRLVWGHWWRTAGIFSVVLFILMAAYLLVGFVGGLTAALGTQGAGMGFLQWVVVPMLTAVVSPVMYAFGMAVLSDLKLRSEGDDLGERIDAIAAA